MGKPNKDCRKWVLWVAAALFLTTPLAMQTGQLAWADSGLVDLARDRLQTRLPASTDRSQWQCRSESICAVRWIPEFYQARQFIPLWFDAGGIKTTALFLIEAIRHIERDGLQPTDYHLKSLEAALLDKEKIFSETLSEQADFWCDFDLLLTDAFLLLNAHLSSGRVNPETLHTDWLLSNHPIDLPAALRAAESQPELEALLQRLRPNHSGYVGLQTALEKMRQMAGHGHWPQVEGEATLRGGDQDPRVGVLRHRLAASGDWMGNVPVADTNLFDSELIAAVKRFQGKHGLNPDGAVGQRTLAALNIPLNERIRQIELNLERWRWLPRDLGRRHIVVNTAAFTLEMVEDNRVALEMRVVVGRPARRTPVLSTPMDFLVLNPYWNVPPKIAVEDMLPQVLKQGPVYLTKQKIKLFNGWTPDADEMDPWSVNWGTYSKHYFPFRLRQDPGVTNSLGQIKFMFPNKFSVYLHDTPNRALFNLAKRDHSSGCIRVEDAFALAVEVLKNDTRWSPDKLRAKLKEGRTQVIRIADPVPVHLLYLTAWVDDEGTLQFREDIYDRDERLDRALKNIDALASQTVLSAVYPKPAELDVVH